MTGDGNFMWWHGVGTQPEHCHGPFETREQAIEDARRGHDADDCGFTVMRADKAVINLDVFDFDGAAETFDNANEQCFGEDGPDWGPVTDEQKKDLEMRLNQAFRAWVKEHDIDLPTAYIFGTTTDEEFFSAEEEDECVGCQKKIASTDLAFRYNDGPVACVDCAPTFEGAEQELVEQLATPSEDAEETERLNKALAHVREQIAAGRGNEKHVW